MTNELLFFGGFILFIVFMLSIDLGIFNKEDHVVGFKEAAIMSGIWVSFAIGFYFILLTEGQALHNIKTYGELVEVTKRNLHNITLLPGHFEKSTQIYNQNLALEFITGYLIEYALSVDNIFVMVLIFTAFSVPEKYYHRVLVWGIIGAILMRFLFIFLGSTLITRFEWIIYVFGAFLVYTGIMMFIERNGEDKIDTENHKVVKFSSRFFRVHPKFEGHKFFIRKNKVRYITPLFLVLLVVEFTDLIFAVDSIPAIFAITKDPFIVFFSNIFAILGLRSMFFLLVNVIHKFHYLKTGLSFLLVFIGLKMLLHTWLTSWGFTTKYSLMAIVIILTISVVASLVFPKKEAAS